MKDNTKNATKILCSIVNNSKPLIRNIQIVTINEITIAYTDFEIDESNYVIFRNSSNEFCSLSAVIPICGIDTITGD